MPNKIPNLIFTQLNQSIIPQINRIIFHLNEIKENFQTFIAIQVNAYTEEKGSDFLTTRLIASNLKKHLDIQTKIFVELNFHERC